MDAANKEKTPAMLGLVDDRPPNKEELAQLRLNLSRLSKPGLERTYRRRMMLPITRLGAEERGLAYEEAYKECELKG